MVLKKQDLIFVAGHNGFLGKSILRRLKLFRFQNILIADKKKLDLRYAILKGCTLAGTICFFFEGDSFALPNLWFALGFLI
jgi:hypothetical protein